MHRLLSSPFAKGALGAFCVLVLAAIALFWWHLYTDHLAFHVMLEYLNQHSGAINKLAAP